MKPGIIRTDGMSDQFFSYKVKMCTLLNNFLFIWATTIGLFHISFFKALLINEGEQE
jgi:hypothetical protein